MGENCITCDVVLGEFWGLILLLAAVLDNTPFGNQILLFTFLPAFSFRNDLRWHNRFISRFYRHCLFGRPSGGVVFLFYVFTGILFSERPPGAWSFCFTFLPAFSFRNDLRWPYLSLREERYGRKTRQRAPKPPFGILLLYGGLEGRRADFSTCSHWCN